MSAPPLPGIFASLAPVLDHWGYLAVAGFLVLEDFGVPVPGETILIAASVYAGAGRLNVVAVGIIGFLAAVAGDNIGFAIGHFGGRALALRWGRYVFLTPERLDKTEAFFERHGGKIIVVAGGALSPSTRSAPRCGSASGSASATWPETTSPSSTTR